jgi:hypothetical protein
MWRLSGAISAGGTVRVTGSTLSANDGGAITAVTAAVITNSTLVGNRAPSYSGRALKTPSLDMAYSTVIDDPAAQTGFALEVFGTARLFANALIRSGEAVLCGSSAYTPTFESWGSNFANETANSCNLVAAGDRSDDANDPRLASLGDNGGPTPTTLPLDGSPLLDAIPNSSCAVGDALVGFAIRTDQRGVERPDPQGAPCDIGAVELPHIPVVTPTFTA